MPIEDKCGTGAVATQTIGDCRLSIRFQLKIKSTIGNWQSALAIGRYRSRTI